MVMIEITRQYMKQRFLNRPEQLTKVKREIGFLLWLYLEPRLESLAGGTYTSFLTNLIKELNLPKATWHDKPSWRKRQFEEAIKEFKGKTTGSGKAFHLAIEKGDHPDYTLTAHLTESVAQLPAQNP